jgi:hypothetical protein
MTSTNVYAHPEPLPESERLGDFRATPRTTAQTAQLYWDVYLKDRSVGQLDGITARQVRQVLRVMCKVQELSADDTRAEIRRALGAR